MNRYMAGASLLALVACAGTAHAAAAAATAATTETGATVSEVIVTGTRQTGVKAVDSAAPIQVVGGEALKTVGQPDIIQVLSQNLPSFNAQGYGADTAQLTLSAALRGLSPNDTLVLVNGKRRHTTANLAVDQGSPYTGAAATDLSFIPLASIDHVEVLQDGAAAQYGSDAIAGVVNVILKKNDHAGEIVLTGGNYYENGGATGAWSINKGFSLGGKGFLNVTLEERYHDFSHQGRCDVRVSNPDCSLRSVISSDPVVNAIDLAGVTHALDYPNVNHIYGDPQYNIYNAFLNAAYDVGGGVQLYAFGNYGHRNSSAYENYRLPGKVIIEGSTVANSVVPYPNGFNPREGIKEDDYAITGGIKGENGGWNWDLSTTYGSDRDIVSTRDSANLDLLVATGSTPTQFFDGTFGNNTWDSNLDISREFAIGAASPLNVAFGGEARRDKFSIGKGDAASSFGAGAQSYPGFQATDQGSHSRTNYAAYVDFAVDPVAGLHVDLAGRYEDYSDFGSTEVGKLTARYDFDPMFAIRGTISTGFRAPTLAEEFYSATNVSPNFASVQLPADSPAALLAGFQPLKPEKSTNYSVGFVSHPMDRLSITGDFYEIDIRDRITNSGFLLGSTCSAPTNGPCPAANLTIVSQGVLNAIAAHGNVLDTGISYAGITVFTNAANTRTQGVEITANYATDFGDYGHIDWSVGFNYNHTKITKQLPLPAAVTNVATGQTTILNPFALTGLTKATPQEKAVIGIYYTKDKWSVNLRDTIYGISSEVVSPDQTGNAIPGPATLLRVPVSSITDLNIGYRITSALRIDVGANNLFDHRPPTVPLLANGKPADGNNTNGEPYQFSPFGINGGYYYGKITLDF